MELKLKVEVEVEVEVNAYNCTNMELKQNFHSVFEINLNNL